MDMSDKRIEGLGLVAGTGGIRVDFYYDQVEIAPPPGGTPRTEARLFVRKRPRGDRMTEARECITEQEAGQRWPREWAAFQATGETPTTGTPLSDLPGITKRQISLLNAYNIGSVQDLLAMDRGRISEMGTDATRAQMLARTWHEQQVEQREVIDVADLMAKMQARDDANERQMNLLREANARMQAQIEIMRSIGLPEQRAQQGNSMIEMVDATPDLGESLPNPMAMGSAIVDVTDPLAIDDGE
jgi:hypothetical protein